MGKQDWETPWELFYALEAKFRFTIDGAARADNTKCPRFISPQQNAHVTELHNEVIFCNPPYQDVMPWVDTFEHWHKAGNTVVTLLQDKTDTKWFLRLWQGCREIWFLQPRINFIGTETGNMHGAIVAVYDHVPTSNRAMIWNWLEDKFYD